MAMKLNDELNATRGVTTFRIPLDKVTVKKGFNTRFGPPDPDKRARLKDLIRTEGQRIPVEGWVQPDRTVVIADGHQRYEILCELEKEDPQGRTLLVIPFQGNEQDAKLRSITANIGQTGLTLMDNVVNWNYLISAVGKPVAEVAELYKVSPATITEGLKLLQLDRKHQQLVHEGKLSQSMALRLVRYPAEKREPILEEMERVLADRLKRAELDVEEAGISKYETEADEQDAPRMLIQEERKQLLDKEIEIDEFMAGCAGPVPIPEPPIAQSAPPAPALQKAARKRTVKTATEADLLKAAENVGVQTGTEPPRKMKELTTYLDAFLEETPSCEATELVKDLKAFIARKLTETQMDNRLIKRTGSELGKVISDPKKGKGGKK